ncbi:MAG: hypothetical protein WDN26_02935 [Chitinophagaceae bacterium]
MVTPYKENISIQNLVSGYAARFPNKVRFLSPDLVNMGAAENNSDHAEI